MQKLIQRTHPSWHSLINEAFKAMNTDYLLGLEQRLDWLPGQDALFAAFSQPLPQVNYILLGESPYPRAQSANGYAFWDAAVGKLWSDTGLSKEVNRATSLRNLIKMLLVTEGALAEDYSQQAIQALDKSEYVQTAAQFFQGLIARGFLLLNASLVYSADQVKYHAGHWQPFMRVLFHQLAAARSDIQFILFGQIARQIPETNLFSCVIAEHPYNLSFITNKNVQAFFKPLYLLRPYDHIHH